MGKSEKRRSGGSDLEDTTSAGNHRGGQATHGNSNGLRGESEHKSRREDSTYSRSSGGASEDRTALEAQTSLDFGPYTDAVEELNRHMIASQKAMKHVSSLFTKHKRHINEVTETREQLRETRMQCRKYKTTIDTLGNIEKEKEEKLDKSMEDVKMQRQELARAKEEAEKHETEMKEKREKFNEEVRETEAKQKLQLDEQRSKLEKEQEKKYKKLVENLEKETKERKDGDEKKIAELEAKNEGLLQKLGEQEGKLRQAEARCKDQEMLKTIYETKAEKLSRNLKEAENEFGLNTGTTEYYKEKFLKIYNDIQDISSRYLKELQVNDLKTIHNEIGKLDKDFALIPISVSKISADLRVAHAQRVISSHLCGTIWQPFSSEITLQDHNNVSLLSRISKGLLTFPQGRSSSFRAARVCTALVMRGLQSHSPASLSSASDSSLPTPPRRADIFAEKVMAVLSLLVKPSLHPRLRNSLINLAHSAIVVWDAAQTDEREFTVHTVLDVERLEEWRSPIFHKGATGEKMSVHHDEIFVLFPRVTARDCSRVADACPTGPPGMWVESDPEPHVRETCIFSGIGLGKWSELVLEGEEEEEERREDEERKEAEKKKMMYEEELRNIEEKTRRRISHSKKESATESRSSPSSPTARMPEGGD